MADEDEVEIVAQALYSFERNARGWDREPELLKEQYRRDAIIVIDTLSAHRAERARLEKAATLQLIVPCLTWLPFAARLSEVI